GNFYGTTYNTNSGAPDDRGTIYRLDAAGGFTTLHVFTGGVDGMNPIAALTQATDGSFYGTTYGGRGTVFKLDAAGTLATIHSFSNFAGANDGSNPYAPVMQASDGTFYGTTSKGGATDGGTVFRLDGAATFTTLHSFTGGSDGAYPYAG